MQQWAPSKHKQARTLAQ